MIAKYDSADFWYTYLNSLENYGLVGRGGMEMNEETQEKLLAYLKTKIEAGVSDGQTALPPGLHDYFWRFPKEMLPRLRTLAESVLENRFKQRRGIYNLGDSSSGGYGAG